ncbi:MAG: hypothetical protein RLZ56_66 [Bacteroidota bacterium]|jgi:hypothetical protein
MKKTKQLCAYCFLFFCCILFASCSKDVAEVSINSSSHFLASKTWYLDYTQSITNAGTITKNFIGQPTYYISFLTDLSTEDSDGITGTYAIERPNNQLQIHVKAHTTNGNPIEYIYSIESIGDKNLVLSYNSSNTITKQFYSTK